MHFRLNRGLTLVALLLVGCATDHARTPEGGLEIRVESDLAAPKDIDRVVLSVTRANKTLLSQDQKLGAGDLLLPASFFLASDGDQVPVVVRGVAFKDGAPRIERSAVTQIPTSRKALLELPLNYLCDGTAEADLSSSCGTAETCKQGDCDTSAVSQTDLPPATPEGTAPMPDAGTAALCFDVQACFAGATSYPLDDDDDDCSVSVPAGLDASRLNVALTFPAGSAGICSDRACWVMLDPGPDGWLLDGAKLELAPGVCRNSQPALAIAVTTACATNADDSPPCGSWSSAQTPVESPPPKAVTDACGADNSRACGLCGMQTRTCTDGTWSDWSACAGEGECTPDDQRACGSAGTQQCDSDCHFTACANQTCAGADTRSCGNCGTQTRSCDNGVWSKWAACQNEGECAPDTTSDCDNGGKQSCGGDCHWGACLNQSCSGAPTRSCGNCGTQTRTCNAATATWSAWSACAKEGECAPDSTTSCGTGGTKVCGGDCHYGTICGGQSCSGAGVQSCGTQCGTQSRTCDPNTGTLSAWSACSDGGPCVAGSRMSCASNGSSSCDTSCHWGACQCDAGFTSCSAGCFDLQHDAAHCGDCGQTCPSGASCQNGVCSCASGAHVCSGACVSNSALSSCGPTSCAACSAPTNGSATCDGSSCGMSCAAGRSLCGSTCIDLQSDASHCGSCATACSAGHMCQAGTCNEPIDIAFASGVDWQWFNGDLSGASGAAIGNAALVCVGTSHPSNCLAGSVVYQSGAGGGWNANLASYPDAHWIWRGDVTATGAADLVYAVFQKTFQLGSSPTGVIYLAADDFAQVRVNGVVVGQIGSVSNVSAASQAQSTLTTIALAGLVPGTNTITVIGQNGPASFAGCPGPCQYAVNTAGVVFAGTLSSQ